MTFGVRKMLGEREGDVPLSVPVDAMVRFGVGSHISWFPAPSVQHFVALL